jgi:hypothetical protein
MGPKYEASEDVRALASGTNKDAKMSTRFSKAEDVPLWLWNLTMLGLSQEDYIVRTRGELWESYQIIRKQIESLCKRTEGRTRIVS